MQGPRRYQNVANLITACLAEGQEKGVPLIDRGWMDAATTEGLIALSGFRMAMSAARWATRARPMRWRWPTIGGQLFGDRYYLELRGWAAPTMKPGGEDRGVEQKKPHRRGCHHDVRFLAPSDFESHEARCVSRRRATGEPSRPRRYTEAQYLRSPEEMATLFADIPEALQNTVEIARRCSLPLKLGESRLPVFPLPAGVAVEDHIREESLRGYEAREKAFDDSQKARIDVYRARLDRELGVISEMGFAGYFLIVADFIRWARANGVPVARAAAPAPDRWSPTAWASRYRSVEIRSWLFERFLNPERVSMPDFDIDFCCDGRDRVIEYVSQKYGRERVSQIITYGTMAAKRP